MTYLVKAIKYLHPEAEFSFTDNDYSTIKWDVLEGKAPTLAEIEAAIETVKEIEAAAQAELEDKRAKILDRIGLTANELRIALG